MAGDSRSGGETFVVQLRRPKVEVRTGGVVVGGSGSVAFDRVLDRVDWARGPSAWLEDILKHCAQCEVKPKAGECVIGFQGRLYYYDDGMIYEPSEKYAACGTGALVCMGYLAGSYLLPPQDRVIGAVKHAALHVPSVGGKVRSVVGQL